jgi:uncharacterized protein (TIGR03437 family)
MALVFGRAPEQREALGRFLGEVQDPSHPNYHKWLTPEEFGERFGTGPEQMRQVLDWLRSEGFTVQSTARGRGWIVFSGTVGQAENAFHTEIHRYQVGTKTHFAPDRPPSVPAQFAQLVESIRGLDDFFLESTTHPRPMFTASDGSHALAPGDLSAIYGFSSGSSAGAGLTIAVAGQSDVDLADIRLFRSTFQLPANDPQLLLFGDDPGIDNSGPFQEGESDLEWAGGVAPSATILYAYSTDVIFAAQNVIDQDLAPILTFSFESCEPSLPSGFATFIQGLAQQANAQGMTWIAASGDAGAAGCDQGSYPASQGLAVSFPASLPEVTAVGGTEFDEQPSVWSNTNNPNGSSIYGYLPEIAWNDTSAVAGLSASGGGASVLFPKPSWQVAPGVPNDGARDVPDLALTASPFHDPYLVILNGNAYAAGGTSLATPSFAGILALAEQSAGGTNGSFPGYGNINPLLYQTAAQPYGTNSFHDITTGSNQVPCTARTADCVAGSLGYTAGPGYDLVTGLGSPRYLSVQAVTTTTVTAPETQVPEGALVTLTATVQSYNGTVPTGYVGFMDGANTIFENYIQSGFTLDASGSASIQVPLQQGTHSIRAGYTSSLSRYTDSISTTVEVVVVPAPPQPPVLTSPAGGATGQGVSVSLTWSAVPFVNSYDVYFGTSPSPAFWGNVASTSIVPGALAQGATYYWQVVAKNASGSTASPVWSFTTSGTIVYTISTIAGQSATNGFSPDGTPAVNALLWLPTDVAFDPSGNLYIAEYGYGPNDGRIRMINAGGILTTVAGGGTGGDGGPATGAQLTAPEAIAIDSQGNLYISDTQYQLSNRVRKVSDGIITTIAGSATAGYSGDGGPAVNAQLNNPLGLAVDSQGDLFIADTSNHCVREIIKGIISTFAGQCGSSGAGGDGGPATSASLYDPNGVAVDGSGAVYIADTGNCKIRRVANGGITTVVDLSVAGQVCYGPERIVIDSTGSLYFSHVGVSKFANGLATLIAGGGQFTPGNGGPGTAAELGLVGGLAVDSAGNVYFADGSSIRGLSPSYSEPAPSVTSNGVANGASFAAAPVAPGSIAAAFGNFGYGSTALASSTPLPTAMSGLSFQMESGAALNAPLFYVSPSQVNLQIPWELAGQSSVSIRPVLFGVAGAIQTLRLAPFAPGIFVGAYGQAAIVDASNNLVFDSNPASAGSLIQIYCTGLGAVTNPPASGAAASTTTLSPTTSNPTVMIGGLLAKVVFSGLAPGTVGEYQVQVQVPAGVASGSAIPVVLSMGGAISNIVTIDVK